MAPQSKDDHRRGMKWGAAGLGALLLVIGPVAARAMVAAAAIADDAPKVVEQSPPPFACDVDAKSVQQLTVTFDQPMNQTGWSFCGGGPNYPKMKGRPRWKDAKTIVADVELEADHDYSLSLNCPAASNFRSAKGVALAPVPWSFTTLPAKLPDPVAQKSRNTKALETLLKTLAEHYSYYDLRVKDWTKLEKEFHAPLVNAKTDRAWASIAARMLTPTQDIHMYLRCGDSTFPTGTRAIDPLYRDNLLAKYVKTQPAGEQALYGKTDDGIGYLMISGWPANLDVAAIDKALTELQETKGLVLDVRPNCGGDEEVAMKVAAWFVDGSHVYGKDRFRVKAGKEGFGPILDRTIQGNGDPKRRYGGKVALLTSRYVMSSNESFVLMMKQDKGCTVVGQPTYGCSGNPKPFDLGNGVTIVVPSWQDLRIDGTCFEGEGLAPDVTVDVKPGDLDTKDPILERALELLRGKGKKG